MDKLAGRALIAQRLGDETEWLGTANPAGHLQLDEYPPVINLRPRKQITRALQQSPSS